MGMKGNVRRNMVRHMCALLYRLPLPQDGHLIHSNVDTDVIIAGEMPFGCACITVCVRVGACVLCVCPSEALIAYTATQKPKELYSIIEHFAQGRRRLELFGEVRAYLVCLCVAHSESITCIVVSCVSHRF